MSNDEWTVERLIHLAQRMDEIYRPGEETAINHRTVAFGARKWARSKEIYT